MVVSRFWSVPLIEARRAGVAIVGTGLVSYVIFLLYPTYIDHFVIKGESWSERLMRWIYKVDRRNNTFPSGHVAYGLVCWVFVLRWSLIEGVLMLPVLFLLIASTVLLKQHYFWWKYRK